jgi:hypothetical protein
VVTWTSSDSGVLTIDAGGVASAMAKGIATVTATTDSGQSAVLQVLVVPNYQGVWTGNTTIAACTDLAGFASMSYCSRNLGTAQTLTLNLAQNGLLITGTVTKTDSGGRVSGAISGTVGVNGDITALTGTLSGLSDGVNLTVTPISWNSLATGNSMTGVWAANLTSPQVIGIATVQWSLTGVVLESR